MTLEEIKVLSAEQIDTRIDEIRSEMTDETAESFTEEIDALEVRKNEIVKEVEERKALEKEVIQRGKEVEKKEEKIMTNNEIRNTPEYMEAFKKYILTGSDAECRTLLSENVQNGTVLVPSLVEDKMHTAWESNEIVKRISKSYFKGNLRIGFEISGTGAFVHTEGSEAGAEEELTLGSVDLVPQTIKKYITITDEIIDARGEEFIAYIYDEIAHKLAKKLAESVVTVISVDAVNNSMASTLSAAPSATTCINAFANLSDEAQNPVCIMNKLTYAAFKSILTADGYPLQDPFAGMEVLFDNSLPAYAAASSSDPYMIVGDLTSGVRANFPNGDEPTFKYDDLSLAEHDLVKIVGRIPVGLGVIAPARFCVVTKP